MAAIEPIREAPDGVRDGWRDALGKPAEWLRDIAISVAGNIWLGLVGPFGAQRTTPVIDRVACYLSMSLVAVSAYVLAGRLAAEWGRRRGLSPWLSVTGAILLVSIPMSRFVAFMVPRFLSQRPSGQSALEWYVQVILLILPMAWIYVGVGTMAARLQFQRARAEAPPAPTTSEEPTVRLLARLPERLGREILALQAEDHYVRVHTAIGSHLVLMRFTDAVAELDGLLGTKVHRSWWAAQSAVVSNRADGRRAILTLSNGLEVPVSRGMAKAWATKLDAMSASRKSSPPKT